MPREGGRPVIRAEPELQAREVRSDIEKIRVILNLETLSLERQQFIETIAPLLHVPPEIGQEIASEAHTALTNPELFRTLTQLIGVLSNPEMSETDRVSALEAWRIYQSGDIQGFQARVDGITSSGDVFQAEQERNEWTIQDRVGFLPFFEDNVNRPYYNSLSYAGQVEVMEQIIGQYANERGIQMDLQSIRNMAESFATIMHGIIAGEDTETLLRVRNEDTIEGVRAAATYITISERNALTAYFEGTAAVLTSPLEQQLLMVGSFLDALRNFGLEMSEEEEELRREMEVYAEEREKLASELEEAKTRFARQLIEMGDEGGLKFIAQALEGNAAPGSAEWDSFWTRERALAFKNALRG